MKSFCKISCEIFPQTWCEFFLCLCTNLYLWWLYFTIYWRKSCSWRIILAINIKITYNAIHQRHLMTGLRRKISATMRLSWKFSQSKKSWFTVCHCQLCGSFFSPCCWWAILFFILVYFWGWRKLYMKEWIKVSPTASTIT